MSTQAPVGEHYEGTSAGLKKDSPWLASEDLAGGEMRVTVEDVLLHRDVKFEQGRTEKKVAALKFVGVAKQMVLNGTNRKTMVRLFDFQASNWRGQDVILWVDRNVPLAGKVVPGLRIKEAPPLPKEKPCPLTNLPSAWLTWSNEEKGEHVATRGTADLKLWWQWLPKSDRDALSSKLDGWKATAEAKN